MVGSRVCVTGPIWEMVALVVPLPSQVSAAAGDARGRLAAQDALAAGHRDRLRCAAGHARQRAAGFRALDLPRRMQSGYSAPLQYRCCSRAPARWRPARSGTACRRESDRGAARSWPAGRAALPEPDTAATGQARRAGPARWKTAGPRPMKPARKCTSRPRRIYEGWYEKFVMMLLPHCADFPPTRPDNASASEM